VKYALTLTVEDSTEGFVAEREKLVLRAHPSELPWHIGLKVIAYVLHLEQRPQVEESVGFRFKPDLAAVDESGRVRLWVDCGNIAVKKIRRVAAWLPEGAVFEILRREERDGRALAAAVAGAEPLKHALELAWFDDGFVDAFAEGLDSSNTLHCVRSPRRLEMTLTNRGGTYDLGSARHAVTLGRRR
jgi:uncharacterized protein YaeQ